MKIQLICQNSKCNKSFERRASEHKYNEKKGRKHYCSQSCGQIANPTQPKRRNLSGLRSDNRGDKYTGLREFVTRIKQRAKENSKFICQLTLQDLKAQFDLQKGICPYSGVQLILPKYDAKPPKTHMASLDRKDSTKGYTADNIQFVSACINYMKNDLTTQEFEQFLQTVVKYNCASRGTRTHNP